MWDVEVDCPLYTEDVTPGTTPRDHTPMMRRDSGGSSEGTESPTGGRRLTGDTIYLNGDATDSPLFHDGSKYNSHLGYENEALATSSNAIVNGIDANANSANAVDN